MKRPTPRRLLFVIFCAALFYLWLRLTDGRDPAASAIPAGLPFRDDWRERMELNRVNGRNGWIELPQRWRP